MTTSHTPASVVGEAAGAGLTLPEVATSPGAASGSPLVITVHGTPAPQGSKRHVGGGRMVESSKAVKPWREAVKWAALEAMAYHTEQVRFTGPVSVTGTFYLPRPRSHYRTGRHANELRDNAPLYVGRRPDLDKLLRSTLDGLGESGCWVDDGQVAFVGMCKVYANTHAAVTVGAQITISEIA